MDLGTLKRWWHRLPRDVAFRSARRRYPSRRLCLEELEARLAPAASVSIAGAASATVTAGTTAVVTYNNGTSTGGEVVTFALSTSMSAGGTFGSTTDNTNGTYTAVFTGSTAGMNTISPQVGGNPVAGVTPATVTVNAGAASMSTSTITVAQPSTISLNPPTTTSGTATVTLMVEDSFNNLLISSNPTVQFFVSGTAGGTVSAASGGSGVYTATYTVSTTSTPTGTSGVDKITATINGAAVTSTAPTITVTTPVNPSASTITASPTSIALGSTSTITLQAVDVSGNNMTTGGLGVAFTATQSVDGIVSPIGTFSTVTDNSNGTYTAIYTASSTTADAVVSTDPTSGVTISSTINGSAGPSTTISVNPGAVSAANSFVTVTSSTIIASESTTVTLQAVDANGNNLATGGQTVTFGLATATGTEATGTFSAVTDNSDGTYTATFTSTTAGTATITATINGTTVTGTPTPPDSDEITVIPVTLKISNAPTTVVAGRPFNVTVSVEASGSPATGFAGTLSFSGTAGPWGLPQSYTFTAADFDSATGNVQHTFTMGLRAVGNQSIFISTPGSLERATINARGFYQYRLTVAAGGSGAATAILGPTTINHAPVLSAGSPLLPAVAANETDPAGVTVGSLVGSFIRDADAGAKKGIAVIGVSGARNGQWQFFTDDDHGWTAFGAVSSGHARLLDASQLIRFVPNAGYTLTRAVSVLPWIRYRAWDETSGTAGQTANIRVKGGTTAFSTVTQVARVRVNTAPVLTSAAPTFSTSRTTFISTVAGLLGNTVQDVGLGTRQGIAVTGLTTTAGGRWQFSVDRGATFVNFSAVSESAARLLRATDLVRYVAVAGGNGTATISYRAWDQTTGLAGKVFDTTFNAHGAVSSGLNTGSLAVT